MGALHPLALLGLLAVVVPLYLHLFHRRQAARVAFPALRYLRRTEREHARRIRLRQLLLLTARVLTVSALAGAGAALFLKSGGTHHPPTAVAFLMDNSLSSGRVRGEGRFLDALKQRAEATLDRARPEDRFFVLEAGRPWRLARPLPAEEARARIADVQPNAAAGDLIAGLERARALAAAAGLEAAEVQVLSDLQATNVRGDGPSPGAPVAPEAALDAAPHEEAGPKPEPEPLTGSGGPGSPLVTVVWRPAGPLPPNHAVTALRVGGGLPPLQGRRSEVTVRVKAWGEDAAALPLRLLVDGRLRGAASAAPGSETSLDLPPVGDGWVTGWVETDADALAEDDRRYFAFRARATPRVGVRGEPNRFIQEAFRVLTSAGRMTPAAAADAELVWILGEGVAGSVAVPGAVVVVPPRDPALLPAVNRFLARRGIPWRLGPPGKGGRAPLAGPLLPGPLEGVAALPRFPLSLEAEPASPPRVLALTAGEPWLVEGLDREGRPYLLFASSLDPDATDLPLTPAMIPTLDWVVTAWAGGDAAGDDRTAGAPLPAPQGADRIRLPSGEVRPVGPARSVRRTDETGIYTFLAGDSVVSRVAVNPPPSESDPGRLDVTEVERIFGAEAVVISDPGAWAERVFVSRQGPNLTALLLGAAVLLLVLESLLASAGRA
ncbi:MAG: BatA domain-containing protein [Gemmatimonadota bacterium]